MTELLEFWGGNPRMSRSSEFAVTTMNPFGRDGLLALYERLWCEVEIIGLVVMPC